MANRFPLIVDSSNQNIKELPDGDNLILGDGEKLILGDGSDLNIFHDGNNSFINNTSGAAGTLSIKSHDINIMSSGSETMAAFVEDGAASLYYDNSPKLATTSTGVDVTGVITTDGLTTSADINFGDNDKAVFGDGSDLQIYHNANTSFITESGSSNLKIGGENLYLQNTAHNENYLEGIANGAVTLYHNGNAKIATTSTGVTVTGALLEGTNRVATNGRAIAFSLLFG